MNTPQPLVSSLYTYILCFPLHGYKPNVRSTWPWYEYRGPLMYIWSVVEVADTPPMTELRFPSGKAFWTLTNTMSKEGKGLVSHVVTAWCNKGLILYFIVLLLLS